MGPWAMEWERSGPAGSANLLNPPSDFEGRKVANGHVRFGQEADVRRASTVAGQWPLSKHFGRLAALRQPRMMTTDG